MAGDSALVIVRPMERYAAEDAAGGGELHEWLQRLLTPDTLSKHAAAARAEMALFVQRCEEVPPTIRRARLSALSRSRSRSRSSLPRSLSAPALALSSFRRRASPRLAPQEGFESAEELQEARLSEADLKELGLSRMRTRKTVFNALDGAR